jgi:hypothetical protein
MKSLKEAIDVLSNDEFRKYFEKYLNKTRLFPDRND